MKREIDVLELGDRAELEVWRENRPNLRLRVATIMSREHEQHCVTCRRGPGFGKVQ